jgi:hypothetical protein
MNSVPQSNLYCRGNEAYILFTPDTDNSVPGKIIIASGDDPVSLDRIISSFGKGMAAKQTKNSQQQTAQNSAPLYCLYRILRTGGCKSAAWG